MVLLPLLAPTGPRVLVVVLVRKLELVIECPEKPMMSIDVQQ